MWIEILIAVLIAIEIGFSIVDRKANKARDKKQIDLQELMVKILGEQKDVLEESNAELADIRDETVEEEVDPISEQQS
jgi:uncharacterized membrane-anchored protein YhcB (DUF1043 family)